MKYNCAVIGLGNIGFRFILDSKRKGTWTHVDAYKKHACTELVGAVENDPKNAEVFKNYNPDIPVYSTIQDLFNDQKVDMVSICVPTKYHFSVFSEIIKYNVKAVFCEKPLSYNVKESEKMVNLAEEKGIVLAVNYTRRWQNSYNLVKEMIKKGDVGSLKTVNCFYSAQIYNIGSHLFDTLMFLTGIRPVMVSALKIKDDGDPSLSGWMKSKDNVMITFSSTGRREDLIFEIDIVGDRGRLRITDNGSKVEWFVFEESSRHSGYRDLIPQMVRPPVENDRFVDSVSDITQALENKGRKLRCSGEDALVVDKIIEKAFISASKKGSCELI